MAVDIPFLRSLRLTRRQVLTRRDVMLYALGVGLGADPTDERQLRYVYEDGLQALPSMAITLAYPDLLAAYAQAGIAPHRVLHGEQSFALARPLPIEAEVEGETRILDLVDKGPGRGLVIYNRTEIRDLAGGETIATVSSSSFCRDEGGALGKMDSGASPITRHAVPERPADAVCALATLPQAALIYRLSGDYNPLHVLPALARAAGHPVPILHGRCTFGVAAHAILRECCDYQAARLLAMTARFTSPVYPGETVSTELWRTEGGVLFRARVAARDRVVLDNGYARIAA